MSCPHCNADFSIGVAHKATCPTQSPRCKKCGSVLQGKNCMNGECDATTFGKTEDIAGRRFAVWINEATGEKTIQNELIRDWDGITRWRWKS